MKNLPGPARAGISAVLNTALDAVIVMRLDGTVAGWNNKAERTFGWSYAEARGRQLSELIIPPQYREAHHNGLTRFLETGEGPVLDRHIEITAIDRRGRELPIELSITCTEQFGDPLFIGFIRDITERREAVLRQERLLRELNHRVKNMLAVVSAIAQQTARSSRDLQDFQQAYLGRLQSLARAHDLLVEGQWQSASMQALAEEVLGPDAEAGRVRFGGPEIALSPRQLLGLSMILHELYTNAVKYGAFSVPEGAVQLDWSLVSDGDFVELRWKENGLSIVERPGRTGFGQKMIAMSVKHDLGGQLEMDWAADGVRAMIRFPVEDQGRSGLWSPPPRAEESSGQ